MSRVKTTRKSDAAGNRVVEAEIEIAAPVDAVWTALTEAEELTRWFPLEARVKPGAGGDVWMSWQNEYVFDQRIEVWEPNRRLVLTSEDWSHGGPRPIRFAVDYTLEGRGGTTILRLVHSGFGAEPSWDGLYDGVDRGWGFELHGLAHYLERHRGTRRDFIYVRQQLDGMTDDEAWRRMTGAEGLRLGEPRPGARFDATGATGDRIQGIMHAWAPPRTFIATVENLGDALMNVRTDECFGNREATICLSTYGLDRDRVEGLRERWGGMLRRLCGPREAAPTARAR